MITPDGICKSDNPMMDGLQMTNHLPPFVGITKSIQKIMHNLPDEAYRCWYDILKRYPDEFPKSERKHARDENKEEERSEGWYVHRFPGDKKGIVVIDLKNWLRMVSRLPNNPTVNAFRDTQVTTMYRAMGGDLVLAEEILKRFHQSTVENNPFCHEFKANIENGSETKEYEEEELDKGNVFKKAKTEDGAIEKIAHTELEEIAMKRKYKIDLNALEEVKAIETETVSQIAKLDVCTRENMLKNDVIAREKIWTIDIMAKEKAAEIDLYAKKTAADIDLLARENSVGKTAEIYIEMKKKMADIDVNAKVKKAELDRLKTIHVNFVNLQPDVEDAIRYLIRKEYTTDPKFVCHSIPPLPMGMSARAVSEILRNHGIKDVTPEIMSAVGVKAAELYREKYGKEVYLKREFYKGGEVIRVNVYLQNDWPLVLKAYELVVG